MDRRYRKKMERYWDKMRDRALRSLSNLDTTGWFDYWHCHIDWQAKGDKEPENRERAIELGYEVLKMAGEIASKVKGPIQYWWFIHESSGEDAVYLHTPNNNGSPFPCDFEGISWGEHGHPKLVQIVDHAKYKVGVIRNEHGVTCVVAPHA